MAAVMMAARARARRQFRTLLGLVLLGGLGAGITLACFAGARRTGTAFDRFEEATRLGEVEVGFSEDIPFDERIALVDRVESLAQVRQSTGASWLFHTMPGQPVDALITIAPLDDRFGREMWAPRLLDGRLPDPERVDEVMINEIAVESLGLEVGDVIDLETVPSDQIEQFFTNQPIEGGDRGSFTVTGVVRFPEDLEPSGGDAYAYLTPAYWDAHARDTAFFGPSIYLETEPGQRAAFDAAASEFLPPSALTDLRLQAQLSVGDATRVQAVSLTIFAAVLGAATLAFVALGYARQAQLADEDTQILEGLGMGRRHRNAVAIAPLLLAGLGAAGLAIVTAVALSPAFPFGIAGDAEPDPGLDVDVLVVLGGALVVAVVLAILASLVVSYGQRRRGRRGSAERPLPVPLVPALGIAMALRPGRGPRAVPVRSALITATVGVAFFVGTLSFGQTLTQLVAEPERYGWNVDLISGTSDDPDTYEDIAPQIEADERIGDWAVATVVEMTADDHGFWLMGLESVEGDIGPVIIEGRAAAADNEIALGRETAAELEAGVGDEVSIAPVDGGDEVQLEVVGLAVLPGGDHDFAGGLGKGGVMTLDGVRSIGDASRHVYLFRAAPGVDPEGLLEDYQAERPGIYGPQPGAEIDNLFEASRIIPAIVFSLAVLACIALGHALAVTVRRRRRDLALLGSLGMRPRQLMGIVLVQAATVALLALVIGVPIGMVLVEPAWSSVAQSLGVGDDVAVFQLLDLVTLAVGLLLVTMVLAALPGRSAARTRPAIVLHEE